MKFKDKLNKSTYIENNFYFLNNRYQTNLKKNKPLKQLRLLIKTKTNTNIKSYN